MGQKSTLPPQPLHLKASGGTSSYTGDSDAYWLTVVGNAAANVTVLKIAEGDDLTNLDLANGQGIYIRSRNVTVNSGEILLSIEQ